MTDEGQKNVPEPGENRDDDTTHIAQRDATRPMPVAPPQGQQPQSTWTGGGASPVGAQQQNAPHPTAYPGAPQGAGAPQSGWAPPQPSQQPQPGQQPQQPQPTWNQPQPPPQGNASAPYQAPSPQYAPPQDPWRPGPPAGQPFSAPVAQQPAGAPYGAGHAYQPVSRPAAKHQLTPLEKFGPFLPALVLFIAAFLTWATFTSGSQTVSLNGVGSNSNGANPDLGGASSTGGWLTIVLALGLVGIGAAAVLGKVRATMVGIVTVVLSLLALVVGLIQFANVSSIVNSDAGRGYSGSTGVGVWLTVFASLVGLGLGVAAIITGRKRTGSDGASHNSAGLGTPSAPVGTQPGQPGQPGQSMPPAGPAPFGAPNQQG